MHMLRACLAIAAAVVLPGCPTDNTCGPDEAAADGLVLSGSGIDVRYHMVVAGQNNDCPDPSVSTADVVSLTVQGLQVGGTIGAITLCIPRPDLLADPMPIINTVPTDHGASAEVVDVGAETGGCTLSRSQTVEPAGTLYAEGLCDQGADPAGFALVVAGQVSVDRDCGGTIDTLRLDLAGTISVAPQL
jgi:hypothetical protein